MADKLTPDEVRALFKEVLHAWLEDKFAAFGKWTLGGLMAAAFAGAIYLALTGMGWRQH